MDRRTFLGTGLVSVSSLLAAPKYARAKAAVSSPDSQQTLLFWDLWRLDRRSKLEHRQGEPEWREEATYVEPNIGALAAWPTVYQEGNRWRMLYSAEWKPYSLMVADSDDGLHWHPSPQPGIKPVGEKRAPHHIFTLPGGSSGAVYIDPVSDQSERFKAFVHQQGDPVAERAIRDPKHRWHEIAKREGSKRYINEEFTLVSADGLHWKERRDLAWSTADWHPEPPIYGYYNHHSKKHMMTVRPGWGDRRQCLQSTTDFRHWSGPELLFQPDALDSELIEHYGLPVFPYADGYVGLLWIFHCESDEPTRAFNRFVGPLDCQLAFSDDGVRFTRGLREPFIPTNAPGEHGGGAIEPSCLVEADNEIRIYSSASKVHHGKGSDARRLGLADSNAILLHTLRKDGFMYLEGRGDWARFTTKPLTLTDATLTMNALAPAGEVRYQLTDMESRPIAGYTFDDCSSLAADDAFNFPLRWRDKNAEELVGKIVRLEVAMRHARLYAFRGGFHFIDAQDRSMIQDGKPIVTRHLPH